MLNIGKCQGFAKLQDLEETTMGQHAYVMYRMVFSNVRAPQLILLGESGLDSI